MPMSLEEAVRLTRALLNTGGTWDEAVARTGWTEWHLRCGIDPTYRHRKADKVRERRAGYVPKRARPANPKPERLSAGPRTPNAVPPDWVLQERDIALEAPITITAALLGDPPPRRSELWKRQNASG